MRHELPRGWAEKRLGEVLHLVNGFAFKPSHWGKKGLPIIRIQNLNNPKAPFNYCKDVLPEKVRVKNGDLLFAWSGTPGTSFGAHIWNGGDAWLNQHIFRVEFDCRLFDKSFLRHAINLNLDHYISQAHGGAGLAHITKGMFEASKLWIAPIAEQRRIVAKLETLLGKVGTCQQRLTKVPILYKRFRQAVLGAACSGRLTADWRESHPQEDWVNVRIKDVAPDISYGYTARASEDPSGVKFLRITDIQNGKVDWEAVPYCKIPASRFCHFSLMDGDILFARTGATTGKSLLIKSCPEAVFASYLIRVRTGERSTPDFLHLFFQSDNYWYQVSEKIAGSAQPNCNAKKLANLSLMLPSIEEQQEIVRRVKALFALADQIEIRYDKALDHIDRFNKALFARALRGELVVAETEIASAEGREFESASDLLARIGAN